MKWASLSAQNGSFAPTEKELNVRLLVPLQAGLAGCAVRARAVIARRLKAMCDEEKAGLGEAARLRER